MEHEGAKDMLEDLITCQRSPLRLMTAAFPNEPIPPRSSPVGITREMAIHLRERATTGYDSGCFRLKSPAEFPLFHRLHIQPARKAVPTPSPRNRAWYGVLALFVIAAGLLWRSRFMPLPSFLAKYGGDALWALMVFVGCGVLLPRASTLTLALLALGFSWAVEFSQLDHAPWLEALRSTIPGRLILGSTFNWPDLPAYAFGIALGAWSEWMFRKPRSI